MIKKQVKTLENLVEEYKSRKVNYSTYEFDELSYRTLILDIHTMLKENQKYKEVIEKVINKLETDIEFCKNDSQGVYDLCNIAIAREKKILNILKEVEHDS